MNPSYIKEIFRWQLLDPGSYDNSLEWASTPSLANKRISNMMMRIFKCINFTNYPAYLKGLFQFRTVRLRMCQSCQNPVCCSEILELAS